MNNLKDYFSYPKFKSRNLKIIFLYQNYFLQKEIINTFQRLGHTIITINITGEAKLLLKQILNTAIENKPDCIMGTNHMGFDAQGETGRILHELNIPVVFWYLDDYRFIIPDTEKQVFSNITLFTYDAADVAGLHKAGFPNVQHLPTASVMEPNSRYQPSERQTDTVFIGNSFHATAQKWERPGYEVIFNKLNRENQVLSRHDYFIDWLTRQQRKYFTNNSEFYHYCGYAAARTSLTKRAGMLKRLSEHSLTIYGDAYWKKLSIKARIRPPVDPDQEAPQIYANALYNLNINSAQLKRAVNLRVFDIPAAGGFQLCEYNEAINELFEPGEEIIVYHSVDELIALLEYYKNRPAIKEKIVRRARERIYKQHLLSHRLHKMLDILQKIYAPLS